MLTSTVLPLALLFCGLFVLRMYLNKWIRLRELHRFDGVPSDMLDKFAEQERVWLRLRRQESGLGGWKGR